VSGKSSSRDAFASFSFASFTPASSSELDFRGGMGVAGMGGKFAGSMVGEGSRDAPPLDGFGLRGVSRSDMVLQLQFSLEMGLQDGYLIAIVYYITKPL